MNPAWIIEDTTPIEAEVVNGGAFGYVQRDLTVQPVYEASPTLIRTYPRVEWSQRIKDKAGTKSRNSDIRNRGMWGAPIPYLNQGSYGYCWAHSAVHAIALTRAKMGLPYIPLSAFAVAATIKGGRNEGGWAALAFDFTMKNGVPSQTLWAQGDARVKPWTGELAEDAAKNKMAEGWWDAGSHPGLRKLTFDQVATLLLDNVATPVEFNWWGHSVLGLDLVEVNPSLDLQDPNRWGIDILNSWQNWGENGVGRLVGNRARPDSAVAVTSVTAA